MQRVRRGGRGDTFERQAKMVDVQGENGSRYDGWMRSGRDGEATPPTHLNAVKVIHGQDGASLVFVAEEAKTLALARGLHQRLTVSEVRKGHKQCKRILDMCVCS